MKLADVPKLAQFLRDTRAMTIAVPIDDQGTPHAAALMYYHTEEPLCFYFITDKNSDKCRLFKQHNSIACAAVVGTEAGVPFSLQMRGALRIVSTKDCQQVIADYYDKRVSKKDDIDDPENVLLQFTPNWLRYKDYSSGYQTYFLDA